MGGRSVETDVLFRERRGNGPLTELGRKRTFKLRHYPRKEQLAIAIEADTPLPTRPKAVEAQYVALRAALAGTGRAGPSNLARQFRGVRPAKLAPTLEALAAMGQAREAGGRRYVAQVATAQR